MSDGNMWLEMASVQQQVAGMTMSSPAGVGDLGGRDLVGLQDSSRDIQTLKRWKQTAISHYEESEMVTCNT